MVVAGMAITMLNDMVAARSFKPTFFTCLKKNFQTSYKGRPCKPGNVIRLLFSLMKVMGLDSIIMRSSFIKISLVFCLFF